MVGMRRLLTSPALRAGALAAGGLTHLRFGASEERAFANLEGRPAADKLKRVSYMSTMRGDAQAASRHLEGIVASAVRNNQRSEISGHLCYDAKLKHVWQVIEGPSADIEKVWAAIAKDQRHLVDEETVSVEAVCARKYPAEWGMRFSAFRSKNFASAPRQEAKGDELLQITYASFVKDQAGEERRVVEEIIPRAIAKNAAMGITSWLLYNDRSLTVYQVLEGPPASVEDLFSKIQQDPRHQVVGDSVVRQAIGSRQFPQPMEMDQVAQSAWSQQSY